MSSNHEMFGAEEGWVAPNVGELVEIGYKIDPDCDWNRHKGLAIVIDTDPDPERPGLLEVRYVKERGLPEEQLPIQTLTNSFSCRRIK